MSALVLNGSTSGQITLQPAAVAGTNTITLPASTGTVALTNTAVFNSATTLSLQTGSTTALYIDASQNVGIGTTSPVGGAGTKLDVRGSITAGQATVGRASLEQGVSTNSGYVAFWNSDLSVRQGYVGYAALAGGGGLTISSDTNNALIFNTNALERMRVDTSGNLLVGTTSQSNGEKFNVTASVGSGLQVARFFNSNSNPAGMLISYSTATPNAASNSFIYTSDATAPRFIVQSNGGIYNYSANNSNLSDERLKKDIQLSGNYLDKLCAIPVKTFLFNDQTDQELNLGVIAQDVLAAAPELVDKDGWGEKAPDGTPYMAIYETDLKYAMLKAIQELKATVDAQAAEITALKAKVGA